MRHKLDAACQLPVGTGGSIQNPSDCCEAVHWQSLPPCFGTLQVHAVSTAAWNLAGVSDMLVGLANKILICVTH
jgi:hypothetical protein